MHVTIEDLISTLFLHNWQMTEMVNICYLASVLVIESQSFCICGAVIKVLVRATRRMFPGAIIIIAERYALD